MSPQLAAVLAIIVFIIVAGLIYYLDIAPGVRTKELRGLIKELDKLAASGSGQMTWRMADDADVGTERGLSYDLTYVWRSDDVRIELVIQQRKNVSATMALILGGKPMPYWHYGPRSKQKLSDLLPDLRKVLGENEVKVVAASPAA